MKVRAVHVVASSVVLLLALIVGSAMTIAAPENDAKAVKPAGGAGEPQMQLPPGWTEADMKACNDACTPGKQHEILAKGVGTWRGKNTMWPFAGGPPIVSESTTTVTAMMGGRFVKTQMTSEVPGMGTYTGEGVNGFDNVNQRFVATWLDNWTTTILNGTGEMSGDGRVFTWQLTMTCPINKKPQVIREVETITGENTKTLEMFTNDPKSGKEYKMMLIELTRQ